MPVVNKKELSAAKEFRPLAFDTFHSSCNLLGRLKMAFYLIVCLLLIKCGFWMTPPYLQTEDRFVVFQCINPENSNILIY